MTIYLLDLLGQSLLVDHVLHVHLVLLLVQVVLMHLVVQNPLDFRVDQMDQLLQLIQDFLANPSLPANLVCLVDH